MHDLSSLLKNFHGAILTKDASSVTPALMHNGRLPPEQQLAIYIDGYRIRLAQAIRSDYPALLALLGESAFDALAQEYIEQQPPAHFSLDRYPHAFAAFIAQHCGDAFALDLAALEAAIAQVFMLDESEPLDPLAFSGLTPEAFGAMVLPLRAASQLLSLRYPVDAWLKAQRDSGVTPRPSPAASYLYVYRHRNTVVRLPLAQPAYLLLELLGRDLSVSHAFEHIETHYPQHGEVVAAHLQEWFAGWVQKGVFRQGNAAPS